MKLLKNISGQLIQLSTGNKTISLASNASIPYYEVVVENPGLVDFNLPLITSYLEQKILTVVTEMPTSIKIGVVSPEVIVNFSPAIPALINVNDSITFENFTSVDLNYAVFTWNFNNTVGLTDITYLNSTTSASKDPVVKFNTAGSYTVTLSILNSDTLKAGSLSKTGLISVI